MAENQGAAAAAEKKNGEKKFEGPRFEIKTPNAGFTGERFGVKFRDGVGATDNEEAAAPLGEIVYAVFDRKSQEVECCSFKITGDRERVRKTADRLGLQYHGDFALTNDPKRAHAAMED